MNILILTGKFGMGHLSAANALQEQLRHDGHRADTVDLFAYAMPELAPAMYGAFNLLVTFGGAVMGENLAWEIADTLNGMMMLPNLIGVLALSPIVVKITRNYIDRKLRKKDVEPMLSNFPDIQKESAEAVKRGER